MQFVIDHSWKPLEGHYFLPLIGWGGMLMLIAAIHLRGKLKRRNRQT